jgi:hypothetical protein
VQRDVLRAAWRAVRLEARAAVVRAGRAERHAGGGS